MTNIEEILLQLKTYLEQTKTEETYRVSEENFSRKGKLNFKGVALLGIQMMKGSLSVELHNLLSINNLEDVSKSAYSQTLYKIVSDFYNDWNKEFIKNLYAPCSETGQINSLSSKGIKGYKIEAIDGSKLILPNLQVIKHHFGFQEGGSKTQKTQTAMCQLMARYDVLNHYILQSEVTPLKTGEITVCKKWIKDLNSGAITVFDRGFGSMFLCHLLQKHRKHFVIRVKIGFNQLVKDFVASDSQDKVVKWIAKENESYGDEFMLKGTPVEVRLVKIILPHGGIEVLMTSLCDSFSLLDLNEIYRMRWGIETAYDRLKGNVQKSVSKNK